MSLIGVKNKYASHEVKKQKKLLLMGIRIWKAWGLESSSDRVEVTWERCHHSTFDNFDIIKNVITPLLTIFISYECVHLKVIMCAII